MNATVLLCLAFVELLQLMHGFCFPTGIEGFHNVVVKHSESPNLARNSRGPTEGFHHRLVVVSYGQLDENDYSPKDSEPGSFVEYLIPYILAVIGCLVVTGIAFQALLNS